MSAAFTQARQMHLGLYETWDYMVNHCQESYDVIWDFVISNWE